MHRNPDADRLLQHFAARGCSSRRDVLRGALGLAACSLLLPSGARGQARTRFVGYPFTLGVASGYPRPDGFSLWTRLAPRPLVPDGGIAPDQWITVTWQVARDERFADVVAEGRVRTVQETAHSVHVDVAGLAPDRAYFYRFIAGDEVSAIGRSWTAPAPGAARDALRFAVASCQHYEQAYFSAYRHLLADRAELIVFVGDYIYESSWGDDLVRQHEAPEPYDLAGYRTRHALYKTDPDLQAAHAAIPWLVTWDDHEVDNDWAGNQAEHLDPRFLARRAAAFQAYWEHMPLPRTMLPGVDGVMRIHTALDIGGLARFHVLDNRQYRSPQPCPDPFKGGGSHYPPRQACPDLENEAATLLGAAQEAWLARSFDESRARWNIIAQQTLMAPMNTDPGDGDALWTDGWDGYPAARERLLDDLLRHRVANPLVVGGDIHANVATNLSHGRRDEVVAAEVCSTSLGAQGWPPELFDAYAKRNPYLFASSAKRGYALVALDEDEGRVDLRVLDSEKRRDSTVSTAASFGLQAGDPGLKPG